MSAINTKKHITEEQKAYLVEFIEKHPQLKSGKFTQTHTHQKAQQLWQQCTEEMNQLVGPQKDWKSWRKCWQDARSKAKKKKSVINKHRNETGGGKPISDELTPIEERIVDLQSVIAVEGHQQTQESCVQWGSLENILPAGISAERIAHLQSVSEVERHQQTEESYEECGSLKNIETPTSGGCPVEQEATKHHKEFRAKRRFATSRLTSSVLETQKFNDLMNTKLTMKQKYYNAKLAIEKEKVTAIKSYHGAKIEKMDLIIDALNSLANKENK